MSSSVEKSGIFGSLESLSTKKPRRDSNIGKSSRLSSITEDMEPQIWENFPKDLFEVVLARLPLATIFRFRTVCQQWHNLVGSQRFSWHFTRVSQANPWFYATFGNNYQAIYDPSMKRWHSVTPKNPVIPVSSAGGLICFYDDKYRDTYVCNPLTQSLKKLPEGSLSGRLFRSGMTVNGSGSYKVLRWSPYGEYEIYDSTTKCWSPRGTLPTYIKLPWYIFTDNVSIDNTIYYKHESPIGIVSCDTSTGVWTQHLISLPRSYDLKLAECDGRILFVGMLTDKDNVKCLCIWELHKITFLLKEVDRIRMSCLEYHCMLVNLTCLGKKGMLMVCLKSDYIYRMFIYKIATREWLKVPVPHSRELHYKDHIHGTAFQPCLTAMP